MPIRITAVMNHLGDKCRHTVMALDGNADAAERIEDGIDVRIIHPEISKKHPIHAIRAIYHHLRGQQPDTLLTYNWGATEWAFVNRFSTGLRHVHFESGFGPEEAFRQKRRRVWFRRVALRRTTAVVVPSENLISIVRDIWKLNPARVQLIPNGVDCARYGAKGDPAILKDFDSQGNVVVGTVAPLRQEKNIGRLIDNFVRATGDGSARLLIVGDGPERPALEERARQSGAPGRIHFAGYISTPEKVFGLMDVFAMSSDTEQMPNALLQAMAAGRPVVATDVGDIRPIVSEDNRRFITPVGDEDAYAAALRELLADPRLMSSLGAENGQRAKDTYSMEKMLAAYESLLLA